MGGQLRSELRKVLSTKLWWGLLAPAAVVAVLINLFGGLFALTLGTVPGDEERLPLLLASLAYGLGLTSVFAGVHGMVSTAGEFRHRTVSTTYLAAPSRTAVLLAKLLVNAGVGTLYAAVAALLGVVAGLAGQASARFPEPGALLTVAAIGCVVCALWGALGAALGMLVANQVAVVVFVLIYVLIGENLASALMQDGGSGSLAPLTPYLPVNAGDVALYDIPAQVLAGGSGTSVVESLAGVTGPPAWWGALLVLAGWTAAAAAAGWVAGGRRDIT